MESDCIPVKERHLPEKVMKNFGNLCREAFSLTEKRPWSRIKKQNKVLEVR